METIVVNGRVTFEYPVAPPVVPPEMSGKRGFILHDHLSAEYDFLPRVYGKTYGLPETEKCGDAVFEQMSRAWQEFWFLWLEFYSPPSYTLATIKNKWRDLTDGGKAFTNKHGSDQYADYINETHLDKAPMAQETLTTCGNEVILTGNNKSFGGIPYVGVLCLDRTYPPPVWIDSPARDCFIHAATVCRPERTTGWKPRRALSPNGQFVVNHFPHTGGNKVPVPFVCNRGTQSVFMNLRVRENWLRADRICKLDDDEQPIATV